MRSRTVSDAPENAGRRAPSPAPSAPRPLVPARDGIPAGAAEDDQRSQEADRAHDHQDDPDEVDADAGDVEVHGPREDRAGGDQEDAESDAHARVLLSGFQAVKRRSAGLGYGYSFASYPGAASIRSKKTPPIPPSDGTLSGGSGAVIVVAVTL